MSTKFISFNELFEIPVDFAVLIVLEIRESTQPADTCIVRELPMKARNLCMQHQSQLDYYQLSRRSKKQRNYRRIANRLWTRHRFLYIGKVKTRHILKYINCITSTSMSSDEENFSEAQESVSERESQFDYPDQLRSRDDDHPYREDDLRNDDSNSNQSSDSDSDVAEEINADQIRMMQLIEATTNKAERPDVPVQLEPKDWITPDVISKYEYTRLIGIRAKQILQCSAIYVSLTEQQKREMGPMAIAERQFKQKTMPLKLKRVHPNGQYQMRDIKDMIGFFELNDIIYE